MKTLEMKIAIPEVRGARFTSAELRDGYILAQFEIEEVGDKKETTPTISKNNFECRIDPEAFPLDAEWFNHNPTTKRQRETKELFLDARSQGRLHSFTCMTIDPSIKDGKLVYEKGLPPAVGFSQRKWEKMLKEYNPSRNSRQLARTEYACRNLYLIWKLVESGYEVEEAWREVCDDSKKIGHYCNSNNAKEDFEPTGSREVCGFCDLANTYKLLAEDPWDKAGGFWDASGGYGDCGDDCPLADLIHNGSVYDDDDGGVGLLALD